MNAEVLYKKLENDFVRPGMSDDWAKHMEGVADFLCDNFKNRSMGLVCDNTEEIGKVYTAVFPTEAVLRHILDKQEKDALLFVHHPAIWDISKAPNVFQQINRDLLRNLRENRISLFNFHVPLDNFGPFSTSVTLTNALGMRIEKPFIEYFGGMAGVIAITGSASLAELASSFEAALGHRIKTYDYGTRNIINGRVAVIAGGGNDCASLKEIAGENINILVTGITRLKPGKPSEQVHALAKEAGISLIGGTHYSTEKFACISICEYFRKLGIESEFIPGEPGFEDL